MAPSGRLTGENRSFRQGAASPLLFEETAKFHGKSILISWISKRAGNMGFAWQSLISCP
jgi:hypothetical protein